MKLMYFVAGLTKNFHSRGIQMLCIACGAELNEQSKFCSKCGGKIPPELEVLEGSRFVISEQNKVGPILIWSAAILVGVFFTLLGIGYLHDRQIKSLVDLAEKQGDAEAAYELAFKYKNGEWVDRSTEDYIHWMNVSSNNGNVNAEIELGKFFMALPLRSEAVRWLSKASEKGNQEAIALLDKAKGMNLIDGPRLQDSEDEIDLTLSNRERKCNSGDGQGLIGRPYCALKGYFRMIF